MSRQKEGRSESIRIKSSKVGNLKSSLYFFSSQERVGEAALVSKTPRMAKKMHTCATVRPDSFLNSKG